MSITWIAIGSAGVIGIVLGAVIGVVAKVFAVEVDERVERVGELLPGANCGGCGYAGCADFAKGVVGGAAMPGQCPVCSPDDVRNIAEYLNISQFEQRAFEARFRGGYRATAAPQQQDEQRYYEVLGLQPGVDFAEIKTAYRKLSMKYHPDKVGHLGDEFKKVAEDKMKELNVAYEYLKKKFQ